MAPSPLRRWPPLRAGVSWRLASLGAVVVFAAPVEDVVKQLPGWNAPLLSKTYAGYVPVGSEDGHNMYEHYLFFESEGDPSKDPVIMWTNGGPGASSFLGSFSELGPYYLSYASLRTASFNASGIPTLFANAFRWTKLGSLLIRNLPPPIGFSYCDPAGPGGDGYSCGTWNDTKVAKHSAEFMRQWMKKFPEFASRDLFLSGESYAGIYVPMLAQEILEGGDALSKQLRGIAVGNGCLGGLEGSTCVPWQGPLFQVQFFHGHGQFSDKTFARIMAVCPHEELLNGVHTPRCKEALAQMQKEIGYSFDYNLYDECYDFALANSNEWDLPGRRYWGPPLLRAGADESHAGAAAGGAGIDGEWHMDGSPCGGISVLTKWVKAPEVRRALNVPEGARFFTGDNGVGFNYNLTQPSLMPWYKSIAEDRRIRVLIYNGDADPGLNSFYAQYWTSHLGLPEAEGWRPWTRDGQRRIGGYVTRYEGGLDFVTVRGAGHMVPEYKPEAAFVMLDSFLKGGDYPRYRPPSSTSPFASSASPFEAGSTEGDRPELIV